MLHGKGMELKFWAEAVNAAVFVLNSTGTSSVQGKTPYELWYGKQTVFRHLHTFGTEVYVHVPKQQRQKLDVKATKGIIVGYDENVKGYRVWIPEARKVEIARDVKFVNDNVAEIKLMEVGAKESVKAKPEMDENQNETIEPVEAVGSQQEAENNEPGKSSPKMKAGWCSMNEENIVEGRLRDRSSRKTTSCKCCGGERCSKAEMAQAMLVVREEPTTYNEAMNSSDRQQWRDAMEEEYESLISNETWKLVEAPDHQKVIDNK